MTPEQEIARLKKLVRAARATLSMEFGLAFGADQISTALVHLGPVYQQKHQIFREFIRAIPADIPYGRARLLWDPAAMLATDKKLAIVENRFRRPVLDECVSILAQYAA